MGAIAGSPFRGLAKVKFDDGLGGHRSYTVSIVDVVPDTAAADQATWEGTPGSLMTLRFEWDTIGVPIFAQADTASVKIRLPDHGSDIGSTWTPTIAGDAGVVTRTFHFDSDPLDEAAGSARIGMIEILITVERAAAVAWGPADSRGGGAEPVGTTFTWAQGYLRARALLASFTISPAALGDDQHAYYRQGYPTYNRASLSGQLYRAASVTLKHRQAAADIRSNADAAAVTQTRDFSYTTGSLLVAGMGKVNSSYATADVVGQVVLPTLAFGGSSDSELLWAASGHASGWTPSGDTLENSLLFSIMPIENTRRARRR